MDTVAAVPGSKNRCCTSTDAAVVAIVVVVALGDSYDRWSAAGRETLSCRPARDGAAAIRK